MNFLAQGTKWGYEDLADLPVQPPLLNFPAHNGPGQGFFGLKAGETFSAQVVGRNEAGLTLLAFGGRQVPVTLPNPPPLGSTLTLQIHQTPQGMQLVLLNTVLPDQKPAPTPPPGAQATHITVGQPGGAAGATLRGEPAASTQAANAQPPNAQNAPAGSVIPPMALPVGSAVVAQAVVAALASQNGAAALFANLIKLGDKARELPPPVRDAIGKLVGVPLDAEKPLDGKTLKQAFQRSGIFLEANLAAQSPRLAPLDLKSLLLSLKSSLGEWLQRPAGPLTVPAPRPPERGRQPGATPLSSGTPTPSTSAREAAQQLFSQTEAALSRLRLLQIASLPDAGHGDKATGAAQRSEWQMELPIMFGGQAGTVNLQVNSDGQKGASGADPDRWQVHLALEAGSLGPISADLHLLGKRVSLTLWAERLEVAQLLHQQLETLAEDLRSVGLEPGQLHVRRPPKENASAVPAGHILDMGT